MCPGAINQLTNYIFKDQWITAIKYLLKISEKKETIKKGIANLLCNPPVISFCKNISLELRTVDSSIFRSTNGVDQ